ncbi:MAG: ABC transporter permease [Chloroflexi bacterium]|nr:ABC transporter permease [Chloroflexota bacterium]
MNRWFELLSTAWTSVITHKLRSFLTVLGVVIGVAAVIALMSVGKGAEASIISNIEGLGSNLLFVRPGFTVQSGVRSAMGSASTLTLEDAVAIANEVPRIATVAPFQSASFQVIAGSENIRSQITGITPEYQQAFNLQLTEGGFITEYEYQRGIKVAVLGPNVRETLFGGNDAVGQSIRLGNSIFRVIGIMESKGASMVGSTDDAILVPLTSLQQTAAQSRTSRGERIIGAIVVSVVDKESTQQVMDNITGLLQERHQLAIGAENDFTITSIEELISTISEAIGTMTLLLGAIAAISLLVGGIGVMNIMLVSVVERTREIGIRKALGAQEGDIWGQFLTEAAFLTFTGGVIGVAVGWGVSAIVSRAGLLPSIVTADIVLLAVGVSVGVGLFFGFYPAWHASRLDPIVALRSE